MFQRWEHLVFLHGTADAGRIQSLLPPGLTVERFEGQAWVGLIPFQMRGIRPRGLPSIPALSNFLETNVRTYVLGPNGEPGVWFFSLDASNSLACSIARTTFGLPYHFASMSLTHSTGKVAFHSRRVKDPTAETSGEVSYSGPTRNALPNTLEHFLVERYRLFSMHRRQLITATVDHFPYTIQTAELSELSDRLLSAAGFGQIELSSALYAQPVDVNVFPWERI